MSVRGWSCVGLLALGAALVGCGGGSAPTPLPEGSGPTAAPSPTQTSTGPGAPVLAAYLAYWDAVIHAHRAANPADPVLARHAAGAELTKVRNAVARNRQQQISIRGTVTHQPRVSAASGATAVVDDCYDISEWNPVSLRTGRPIAATEQGGTGRYRGRFGLRRGAGSWIVVSSSISGAC
ncbi:MAG: hypothetical protein V7637_962 [Mycobacteriales bacterium]|jgi:hypothetical protein